jgi:hypothetical protein
MAEAGESVACAPGGCVVKFAPRQKIYFKSLTSDHTYHGHVVRALKDGFYLVDDGTDRPPRAIHGNRLGTPVVKATQAFA